MEHDESGIRSSHCRCLSCGHKLEFPTQQVGEQIECPNCGARVLLKAAYDPLSNLAGHSSPPTQHVWAWAFGAVVVAIIAMFSVEWSLKYPSVGGGYVQPSREERVKEWESRFRNADRELYGTKVATDEEIHQWATNYEHLEEDGIRPEGMLIREMSGDK